ncbi:MAG: glycosyltransferase, partial [Deltaproteobacteria bacterium]|nr:glycosyltransferase [Deltaproteobacteria bacterium]
MVHDLAQLHVPEKFDRLRMLYARMMFSAFPKATELVAVSEATRADLVGLGLARERVRVVRNGVDAARFEPPAEGDARVQAARSYLALQGAYLLYAARLEHPGKNHLRLLRAFARSAAARSHTLVLAGSDFGAGELVRAEIEKLGLAARVKVAGFVAD